MKWFGPKGAQPPGSPDIERVPIPVGRLCQWCRQEIQLDERGFLVPYLGEHRATEEPWHDACLMRSMIGGLNHIRGNCTCCGGTEPPDPPEMTRREAAVAAVAAWKRRPR